MATVCKRRKKRVHNPTMLAVKRACRALKVNWADLTAERDRLRIGEIDERDYLDEARRVAWSRHSPSQRSFWRFGFKRTYGRRLANGADLTIISNHDGIAESVRQNVPECSEWSLEAIWELLLSDYTPLAEVDQHYEQALSNLLGGRAVVSDVEPTITPF